jgi:hypothetical protein
MTSTRRQEPFWLRFSMPGDGFPQPIVVGREFDHLGGLPLGDDGKYSTVTLVQFQVIRNAECHSALGLGASYPGHSSDPDRDSG